MYVFTWCKYEDHSSINGKDMFVKRKNQSKKYSMFFTASWKTLRKPSRKWSRVFTRGFTAENFKIFYDKLTSSGMVVPVLELDRRQDSPSPWGTCNAKHLIGGVPAPRNLMYGPSFTGSEFVLKNLDIFSSKSFGKNQCRFSCRIS